VKREAERVCREIWQRKEKYSRGAEVAVQCVVAVVQCSVCRGRCVEAGVRGERERAGAVCRGYRCSSLLQERQPHCSFRKAM